MASFSITTWNVLVIVFGYIVSIYGGRLIVGPIITKLWKKHIPDTYKRYPDLVKYVSLLESFIYTTATLIGAKEFIAVWLGLKLAGSWSPTKSEIDRPLYHLFLIGNGLSLTISVGVGLIIKILLRP
jgi:hypothetical protein